ncbi:hypothetical protein DPMN_049708 [Dreissena polymorpha]|uniref:Uncharacterized protein n=1 Tax=Dreissena polymorpha TaxID=45954 RepID=A0A9D4HMF0_DREPO|nr:hypothetical protein DPMN_049708 [Dreissena polymorpha]
MLYTACCWFQRRQQDRSSVQKTIRLQGKDLQNLTTPGNAGTEEQDNKHGQKRSQ